MYATADATADTNADTGVDDEDGRGVGHGRGAGHGTTTTTRPPPAAAFRCSANVTFPVDHPIAFDREIIVSPFSLTQPAVCMRNV